jgi:hypothetical protein
VCNNGSDKLGKPEITPKFVPILPVKGIVPAPVIGPSLVNKTNEAVGPKLGAVRFCARVIFGNRSAKSAAESNYNFVIISRHKLKQQMSEFRNLDKSVKLQNYFF